MVIHFLSRQSRLFQKRVKGISTDVYAAFMNYDWPGNVRELGNVIEYAFNILDGDIIETEHLPAHLLEPGSPSRREYSRLGTLLDAYSRQIVRRALEQHGGNKAEAARSLGISRATLYRILADEHV
jgi:transcriptional regulator with PAS, ATPase and Fis domain